MSIFNKEEHYNFVIGTVKDITEDLINARFALIKAQAWGERDEGFTTHQHSKYNAITNMINALTVCQQQINTQANMFQVLSKHEYHPFDEIMEEV